MAFVLKDRVRMTTATTGAGAITLGSAVANAAQGYFRTFAAAGVANGDTFNYVIEYNVSSVTDLGTGSYRANFATALSNANYAVSVNGLAANGSVSSSAFIASVHGNVTFAPTTKSTTQLQVFTGFSNATNVSPVDSNEVSVIVFGS